MTQPQIGSIGWIDLTVPDAGVLKDFYCRVAGWKSQPVEMEGYSDYCLLAETSNQPISGICHARGGNTGLPPQWLIYITVADLGASLDACLGLGGKVLRNPKAVGDGVFAVIQDPAGAVCALYQVANLKA